jgi:CDP-diglyceride synthetase
MKKRLLGALMVIPAVSLAIIFAPSVVMLVLFFGIAILGILEFYRMLDKAGIPSFRYVGAVCGTMMMLATYLGFVLWGESVGGPARAGEWEGVILTCTVLVLMVRQFPQKHNKRPLATIACTLLGILYVPLLLGFFIKLSLHWEPIEWNRSMAGSTGCYLVF